MNIPRRLTRKSSVHTVWQEAVIESCTDNLYRDRGNTRFIRMKYQEHELWNGQTEAWTTYKFRCWLETNKLIQLLDNPGLSTLQKFPLIEHYFLPLSTSPLPASALASSTGEEWDQSWDKGTSKGPACSQHGGPAATGPAQPGHAQTHPAAVCLHHICGSSASSSLFQRSFCQSRSSRERSHRQTNIYFKTSNQA